MKFCNYLKSKVYIIQQVHMKARDITKYQYCQIYRVRKQIQIRIFKNITRSWIFRKPCDLVWTLVKGSLVGNIVIRYVNLGMPSGSWTLLGFNMQDTQ